MVSSDPAGLLRLECRVGNPQSILVYPATVELSRAVVQGQATGGELGEAGQLAGHSPAASMVRQYIPGDSLTHIHWPTTARLDQLMTKEFEGAGINEIWLFVDLQEAVQAGTGDDNTEEYSITIAASLAKSLIQGGHAVGLVTQGDQFYRFAPGKDHNHLWALLRALALPGQGKREDSPSDPHGPGEWQPGAWDRGYSHCAVAWSGNRPPLSVPDPTWNTGGPRLPGCHQLWQTPLFPLVGRCPCRYPRVGLCRKKGRRIICAPGERAGQDRQLLRPRRRW